MDRRSTVAMRATFQDGTKRMALEPSLLQMAWNAGLTIDSSLVSWKGSRIRAAAPAEGLASSCSGS